MDDQVYVAHCPLEPVLVAYIPNHKPQPVFMSFEGFGHLVLHELAA
jgi:hypothetical protein